MVKDTVSRGLSDPGRERSGTGKALVMLPRGREGIKAVTLSRGHLSNPLQGQQGPSGPEIAAVMIRVGVRRTRRVTLEGNCVARGEALNISKLFFVRQSTG